MRKKFVAVFALLICILSGVSAMSGDSIRISLLTVKPRSNAVYTVFGHTALRLCNLSEKMDVVFNYGTFNFDANSFLYRFMKGETDYFLSMDNYSSFFSHYAHGNATVVEQELRISEKNKTRMYEMLKNNLRPENAVYRYNFVFDNCTTRPRDIIEQFCGGVLQYKEQGSPTTFRNLIHDCTGAYPWITFGIDLLIGSGADTTIQTYRDKLFLPVQLMDALNNAKIQNDTVPAYSIVASSEEIITFQPATSSPPISWSSPMKLGVIMIIHCLVFAICGVIWKKKFRFFFGLMFLNAGLAGCIVAFISLVSVHPCTLPNWNLLWIHPFHLIAVVGYFLKDRANRFISWYHRSNFILLLFLLLAWHFIPQQLNVACVPFIICLLISSGYKLIADKKQLNE